MVTTDTEKLLAAHPLFCGCSHELLTDTLSAGRAVDFAPGEAIRPEAGPAVLCFLLSGSAAVTTPGDGSDCLLRILHTGDAFGVADLFAPGDTSLPVTRVVAEQPTRAMILTEEIVRHLVESDSTFAMNYIGFLSDRIRFLNRRLACLGAGSATRRVAAWLDMTIPEGADRCISPLSLSRLPEALGLSRASLYRALDELEAGGHLHREGKRMTLSDRAALRHTFGLC